MNLLHQGATPSENRKLVLSFFRPDEINFKRRKRGMAVLHPLVTPRGLVNIKEKKRVRQLWWGSLTAALHLHCWKPFRPGGNKRETARWNSGGMEERNKKRKERRGEKKKREVGGVKSGWLPSTLPGWIYKWESCLARVRWIFKYIFLNIKKKELKLQKDLKEPDKSTLMTAPSF